MTKFEIKEEFLLDGQPFKILSGAIHYFRVHPTNWERSLYNLKALGFNTVETYVPWNLHEREEGSYDFSGMLDLAHFLELAKQIGLYAIVRPAPYICAEWEFGGLPAWLLTKECRIRSADPHFMKYVDRYYQALLPKIVPHLVTHGGNVLMVQVENEYGSYGEEKAYLRQVKKYLEEGGIDVPLFTSDGPWQATLRAGSLIDDDVFTTGNFGSKAKENFADMTHFFEAHGKKWPLMCMEFWDGWFNRWKEPVIKRDPEELAESVKEALQIGSINLYMFHGGTNFGFMNGCSARGTIDLPQVTSYDYDAPLDEQGNPTEKYFALKRMMAENFPEIEQMEPWIKATITKKGINLKEKVSFFATLETISEPIHTTYPKTREKLGQNTGYLLYRTTIKKDAVNEKLRIIDGRDRVHVFLNEEKQAIQYQTEIGEVIPLTLEKADYQIDLLFENMGRVNYGHKLLADTQRKGIRTGVMCDLHFITEWTQYCLPLETPERIDFSKKWEAEQPAFYRFEAELSEIGDTYLDVSDFGKGIVWVNGMNIGRFWEVGPILSLFVPEGLLRKGQNEIVIFETEGRFNEVIDFVKEPIEKENE